MRRLSLTLLAGLLLAVSAHAADKPASSPLAAKACAKGELGGIVTTNKKVGKEYVTTIRGDKHQLRTPESAGEVYQAVSKLKAGDLYCYKDEGS
jgi:hypothetical protein